ncbi:hypothetical protein HHX47_DHR10000204 [Lentinula edodes]|nr:hypothetical protein HHX47_DHR10000204 [Lentinula edodes]
MSSVIYYPIMLRFIKFLYSHFANSHLFNSDTNILAAEGSVASANVPRPSVTRKSQSALRTRFSIHPYHDKSPKPPNVLPHSLLPSLRRRFHSNPATPTPSSHLPAHLPPPPTSRKPSPNNSIIANNFRPNVRARYRLQTWDTPFTINKRTLISSIYPPEILELGKKATFAGLADSTKQSYGAGPLRWNQFCDEMSINENLRMPADDTLITAFIGFHMGKVSSSCIKNWLSGLRAWHELAGAPWPANSRLIRFARAGARIAGTSRKRPQRNPITLAHLLALYSALDFSNSFHCAIWAVASTAFWGCRRLGELTIPSKNKFDPKYHVSRSAAFNFAKNPDHSRKSVSFKIPWTKTTKELGASVVCTAQHHSLQSLCPYHAIERHMAVNALIPQTYSLFAYLDDQGLPQHMVKTTFLSFCDRIWNAAGLEHVHGHSFRIGGAVELLIAGVTPEVVAAIGGWTSLAFLLYWRRFEDILPTHVLKAYDSSQISRLKHSLDDFQKANGLSNSLIDACIMGIDITEE